MIRSLVAAALLAVGLTSCAAPTADQAFLQGIAFPIQDGHQGHVLAAGHRVCADLHGGISRDQVVADAVREGIGGDLFTSTGVAQVVASAERNLCPSTPLEGLVRP